ncbi:TetR/AcrR family transcriptional regulator [Phycicoccus sp. BSK3Z-2]|uniref:TetR/AcrR family transcriptional regulator n=1 Tax=Phycicoccus avicenniae TaxID=2828860 RepID=A0A941D6L2_9MICO|nr:TetR family transcriptional regulator [Phycicoccus avicenniae]MBR7742406.1 TetR/AcrR family transcriptional regulator [Phycicoccus avicenniae]
MSTAGTDGRSARWDEHRLARRRELVEATVAAVRTHGAGVGMDGIAASAGTSKTVFYRHFTDRAGLYRGVAERVDGTIIRGITRAAGAGPASGRGDARRVVRAVIGAYLHLVEDDPEVYRFIVNAPILPPGERPDGDVAAGMTTRIAEHVATILGEGLDGSDDPATTRLWGVALVGMVRAAADAWLAEGGAVDGRSADDLADDLTALAWGGLAGHAA